MKYRFVLLFLLSGLTGIAQTAQEIINKHIQAIGGKEKLDALTSFRFKAYDGANTVWFKKPDKLRIEYTENGKLNSTSIYNGAKGWTIFDTGNAELTAPEANVFFNNYLPGLLVYAKEPAYKIEYKGKDEETGDYLISITPKVNNSFGYVYTFYIDPATAMIKKVDEGTDGYFYIYYFEDYKVFNGVKIPLKQVREDGYTAERIPYTVTDMEVNIPLDEKLFEKPANLSKGLKAFEANEKWGFVDMDYNTVVKPVYDNVWDFNDGLAKVEQAGKIGFIDSTGKALGALKYDDAEFFEEGLAAVQLGGKWGYMDKTGKEVIAPAYDKARSFREGLASVAKGGKAGMIDKTGKVVLALQFEDINSLVNGLAAAKQGGKWGFIDKTGKTVVPFLYDSAPSAFTAEGVTVVNKAGKWGMIDKTGKEVIPTVYDNVEGPSEGFLKVQQNKKWGAVDLKNKIVVPVEYDAMWGCSEGCFAVNKGMVNYAGGKWGFIDKTSKLVIPLQYDKIVSNFKNGRAEVQQDGANITIDKTGKTVK